MEEPVESRSLNDYLNRRVVLDTPGDMLFIGRLVAVDDRGFWLVDADVHDRSEGHATNEQYVNDAYHLEQAGCPHVNRKAVFVERSAIICISALEDVVADRPGSESGAWMP